ncbi:MATE efflux family protein [Xylona heveae TC161]|uniref:MATE efflux family protein n=1 Tax=Xylona heveae (strain CBS 132557 / TC161) TaxID=1328760 RepID=A0A165H8E8_XYLHT|nr:MATE efflux family protein [Xylona heveae TC161]KZF23129.1 MATE efflux family protein [Xylona heveae TC161]
MAPSTSRPIAGAAHHQYSPRNSYVGTSPLARQAIARDLRDDVEDPRHPEASLEDGATGSEDEAASDSESSTVRPLKHQSSMGYSMTGSYHRPSFVASGPRGTVLSSLQLPDQNYLTKEEIERINNDERSLLRDNHMIPPKHPRRLSESSGHFTSRIGRQLSIRGDRRKSKHDEETAGTSQAGPADEPPSETTALLGDNQLPYGGEDTPDNIDRKWEAAVAAGKIQTSWQREAKVLGKYSRSLIVTFLLQYSLTVASIFTVGRLGKLELGAVSLASMTANIFGYAIYQGLATSLDTLCAQAYGSGRKHLVGLQFQRMVFFLWVITIPIGIIWLSASAILKHIIPEAKLAELAGLYLKVLLIGAPGYAAFESGKRFVQAQGLFSANMYVLLFCAPLNAFLNWLLVWKLKFGFVGAPIAVAVTDTALPLCLLLYVRFVAGRECWGGFTWRAFHNWGPMIKLALPGLVMVEAEFLAFEILTLVASYISTTHLAAQSVLSTITSITFQIPFPISIAASTRIANLIGATLSDAAKTAAKVCIVVACIVGICNITLLSTLRNYIPQLFTNDPDVIELVAKILPLCAAFQLFDALAANCGGILRGLGRQEVGGYANLFCYYAIAMPLSFSTCFVLHWDLFGLWTGPALALGLVALIEGIFIARTSWDHAVEEAQKRNTLT